MIQVCFCFESFIFILLWRFNLCCLESWDSLSLWKIISGSIGSFKGGRPMTWFSQKYSCSVSMNFKFDMIDPCICEKRNYVYVLMKSVIMQLKNFFNNMNGITMHRSNLSRHDGASIFKSSSTNCLSATLLCFLSEY